MPNARDALAFPSFAVSVCLFNAAEFEHAARQRKRPDNSQLVRQSERARFATRASAVGSHSARSACSNDLNFHTGIGLTPGPACLPAVSDIRGVAL